MVYDTWYSSVVWLWIHRKIMFLWYTRDARSSFDSTRSYYVWMWYKQDSTFAWSKSYYCNFMLIWMFSLWPEVLNWAKLLFTFFWYNFPIWASKIPVDEVHVRNKRWLENIWFSWLWLKFYSSIYLTYAAHLVVPCLNWSLLGTLHFMSLLQLIWFFLVLT